MIVPLGLVPRRGPGSWQSRAAHLVATAVVLLTLGAALRLSTVPAAAPRLATPSIQSLWQPSVARSTIRTAGATLSLRSVEAAQRTAGAALQGWASRLKNATASVGNGNDAPLLPDDGGPLRYMWEARPSGAPGITTTETTTTCERVDRSCNCLLRTQDEGPPVPLADATPTTVNVKLAPHCTQDWVDVWAGEEVIVSHIISALGLDGALPATRLWFAQALPLSLLACPLGLFWSLR
jgi:hypothetical protein